MAINISSLPEKKYAVWLADAKGFIPEFGDRPEQFQYPESASWVKNPDLLTAVTSWQMHIFRCKNALDLCLEK
ncbi:hypothetical protein KKF34_10540 [Myxococcota bacterium]|nr:hypothetical protein [Myxococcota bacterium]MBU1380533.1 hypothetical protein [Myxococcota bacterium]MBU1497304.1 hypothetical protein [Myxococcota bacterium]